MLSAFVNSFKIPELREKIYVTLFLLFIARVGANIPLPGVDPTPLQDFFADQARSGGSSLVGLYNMFTGGALLKGAIFALGIMPYISASIIFQLLAAVWPSLARLQQEGETGKQKLTQYTRYATLIICLVQGLMLVGTLLRPNALFSNYDVGTYGPIVIMEPTWAFVVTSTIFLTAGVMLLMWIGEQITQRGIGNGVSLLITVGILSDLPGAITQTAQLFTAPVGQQATLGLFHAVAMLALLIGVTVGVVAITQALRRIPIQYARRQVGKKVFGGQSSYLPLKINYSGVMPIIFASAIVMFGLNIFDRSGAFLYPHVEWLGEGLSMIGSWFNPEHIGYYIIFGVTIFAFSFLWVSMMFKPVQIADDLKRYGGYIPGVRPGDNTAKYLDFVMTRLTLAGAVFLVAIALFPNFVSHSLGIPYTAAQFFGGTGLLIIVGVLLDFLRQVETYLLQRHYDGFLKKGRIKGRSQSRTAAAAMDVATFANTSRIWIWLLALLGSGLLAHGLMLYLF
ncbi:MAG: preprotein translocase subunit SecY [Verrucomicrobiota bacterium JB022]|nr:preprotein translocase subunit SecY [Verrucomicrobiota bacterium JB022]